MMLCLSSYIIVSVLGAIARPIAGTTPWSADASVLATTAGLLLIYLECNRPGWILPGSAGVLLCLTGLHSLSLLPLRLGAILLIVIAFGTMVLPLRLVSVWGSKVVGSVLLSLGLATLSAQTRWSVLAAACGLLLGPLTTWLVTVAGRARRAKRHHFREHPATSLGGWE